jgi:hypothetical protein
VCVCVCVCDGIFAAFWGPSFHLVLVVLGWLSTARPD